MCSNGSVFILVKTNKVPAAKNRKEAHTHTHTHTHTYRSWLAVIVGVAVRGLIA